MLVKVAVISALATSALAQSSYMTGLINALNGNGLTSLADLLASFDNATLTAIESAISTGNHTLFTPVNDAFGSLSDSVTSNITQVHQVLSYHLLTGVINTTDTSPDKFTIARTSLKGAPAVNLRKFT